MKTKTIALIIAASLLPIIGFAQSPPPSPPGSPAAPGVPGAPKPPDKREKMPKVPVTFLGVETSPVPSVVSEQLGLAKGFGLVVDYVVPDGPAAAAGVQKNDILKMLNDQILMEPGQLAKLVRSFSEGTSVTLTILRKGAETKVTAKLVKKEISSHREFGEEFRKRWKDRDDVGHLNHEMHELRTELGDSIRETVQKARAEAMRAGEEARRAAREIRVLSSGNNGAMKSTKIDLGKAQIVYSDEKGEMKMEMVDGKKVLTAKDPQGKLLFSGPVETNEERDKVPAEIRERFEKLEQKDLPGVVPTVNSSEDDDDDFDIDVDFDLDLDEENESEEPANAAMQQVSVRSFPSRVLGLNTVLI